MNASTFARAFTSLAFLFVFLLLSSGRAYADPQPRWPQATSFGGAGPDSGNAVATDAQGNAYVAGYFSSSARFGKQVLSSVGGTDMFLAKLGPKGKIRWLLGAGGPGDDVAKDIAVDRAGNVYVTGWFTNSASFPSTQQAATTVTGNRETIFLAKYGRTGNLEWVHTGMQASRFPGVNRGHGVAVDAATDEIYITAVSQTDTRFSSADGIAYTVPGAVSWHMVLAKYDADGNFQWGQRNQSSPNSIPHKVAVDADHNVYVTGWMENVTIFHSSDGQEHTVIGISGTVQTPPDYPEDAFIAKYDRDGNVVWVNQIGGYKAIATDIAVSGDDHVSVTGFIGNIDFDQPAQAETVVTSQPDGSSMSLGGGQFTDPFNADIFIATYDSAGVLVTAQRLGAALSDGGSGIAYDEDNNLYVAAVFQGTIDVGGRLVTGNSAHNLLILEYPSDGGVRAWTASGAGTEQFEGNPRLCITATGRVLVTGAYRSTAEFGGATLHSVGAEDIFVAKLQKAPANGVVKERLTDSR